MESLLTSDGVFYDALGVVVIQWLKNNQSTWTTWIDHETKAVNNLIAGVSAIAATAGISYTYDATAGQLIVDGLTTAGILLLVKELVKNFILQKIIYKAAYNNSKAQYVGEKLDSFMNQMTGATGQHPVIPAAPSTHDESSIGA